VKFGVSGAAFLGLPFARAERQLAFRSGPAAPGVPNPFDWASFRNEMKKRNQPGVIVLLQSPPPAAKKAVEDEKLKKRLIEGDACDASVMLQATTLHNLLFSCGNSELPHMLVQAVFVAVPAAEARQEFASLPAGAGLALIGTDGRVLGSLPADADLDKKFIVRAAQLLYGPEDRLLRERVKAERAALGEAACKKLDEAFVDLDDDEFSRRQQGSLTLTGLFARIPASLALAYRNAPSMEVRVRIDSLFRKKLHDENTAALLQRSLAPYAAAILNFDPRPNCGQGALRADAHEFVQRWAAAVAFTS
jgi:hypothetical protein